jgi:gas vesicle protein
MDTPMQESTDYKFVLGLMAGSLFGAALAMWFAPPGSVVREQLSGAATRMGERASGHFQDASARLGEAVDELAQKGREVRDDLAASVARGAHDVERRATAVRTDRHSAL